MSSRLPCKATINKFCYICGHYEPSKTRRLITDSIKIKYSDYFKIPMQNLDKPWLPQSICNSCRIMLIYRGKRDIKTKVILEPAVWREPTNHSDDCYFCACNITGFNERYKNMMVYPSVSSVTPAKFGMHTENENSVEIDDNVCNVSDFESLTLHEDGDFEDVSVSTDPILFEQNSLDDLVRDLGLPKNLAELLASRLAERNMLAPEIKITKYRNREERFRKYFSKHESLVYCNDIEGLINEFIPGIYKSTNWRLFIDSSKTSLKAVLLHNGNKYAAVPLAHSTTLRESYKNLKFLLETIKYSEHDWLICGDLKMINIILGQQSGYTKYPCFLCEWNSRAKDEHWTKKNWPSRSELAIGSKNIINANLVDQKKILLPPLHIKLGLMKQFVKALDVEGQCFKYLYSKFPKLSDVKIKEGIFVGPDIRALMKDDNFIETMTTVEKKAWVSFKSVIENFLGNKRDHKYKEIVSTMLQNFKNLGCKMSLKVHFLFSHMDYFPDNLGNFSEEMGERFHQDIKGKEKHYQGNWNVNMMADYCWCLKRNDNPFKHRRTSLKRSFEEKPQRFHKKIKKN